MESKSHFLAHFIPGMLLGSVVGLAFGSLLVASQIPHQAGSTGESKGMVLSKVPGCTADNAAGYLRVATEQDGKTVHILVNNQVIQDRKFDNPVNPRVFKVINGTGYVSYDPDGLGGYILYTNAYQLDKFDICSGGQGEQVPFAELVSTGYVTDISPDEKTLAVKQFSTAPALGLYDATNGELLGEYPLPDDGYSQMDARFTKDGSKIYVVAAVGDPEKESGIYWIFDIKTRKFETPGTVAPTTALCPSNLWTLYVGKGDELGVTPAEDTDLPKCGGGPIGGIE